MIRIDNLLKIVTITFSCIILNSFSASATSIIQLQTIENKDVVPIKVLTEAMGGKVSRVEADNYTMYEINGKVVYIYDEGLVGYVDGEIAPFETDELTTDLGIKFTIPRMYKPTVKDGDTLVPVDFLKKYTGIKNEGDAFVIKTQDEVSTGDDSSNVVIIQKPAIKANNNSSGSSTNNSTTQNSDATVENSTGGQTTENNSSSATGISPETLSSRLPGLGFWQDKYGAWRWSITPKDPYTTCGVINTSNNIALALERNNPTFDANIRTILKWALPTKGDYAFTKIFGSFSDSTEILDGRTVIFENHSNGISVVIK